MLTAAKMYLFPILVLGWGQAAATNKRLQLFDSCIRYRDMATLSFMLTAADTHLYPILELGSGQATATDKRHVPSPYVTQRPSTLVHTPYVLMYLNTCKV